MLKKALKSESATPLLATHSATAQSTLKSQNLKFISVLYSQQLNHHQLSTILSHNGINEIEGTFGRTGLFN
jgi:hypothetical protein